MVVLNLFVEYLPRVISETFTLSLLTAVLLKGILDIVVAAKNRSMKVPRRLQIAQRLLLHRLGARGQPRVLRSRGGELPTLFQVARRARSARVPVGVLLDGEVPDIPGVAAVVPQHGLLGGRGEQPVPGHANTLAITTDISGEVTRRFLPGLKTGVSTPRF